MPVVGLPLRWVRACLLPCQANAAKGYKDCLEASSGEEVVYSNLFTGVHGNYLTRSIEAAGLNPRELPQGHKSKMNFASTKKGGSIGGAKASRPVHATQRTRLPRLVAFTAR